MDREANYVAVGTFVLVVLAMATVFVLWYTNSSDRREYQRYEVYFSGSVSGLQEGSTVRYLGVNVGRVARIRLDSRAGDRVLVLVDVDKATPVRADTVARLSMQGITGLLFIDLSQAHELPHSAADISSQEYPVIRSASSDFDRLIAGMPALVADANRVMRQVNKLLDDDNVHALSATFRNAQATSESLPQAARNATQLIQETRTLVADLRETARGAGHLVGAAGPQLESTLANLKVTSDSLAAASHRIDALLARHEADIDDFAGQGLGEVTALAAESRAAAAEVRELAKSLREDPSRLLYPEQPHGVEIPR
jgi:phospholipid/cholesterol/gamma-HCH transport system substrate-binding protein